MSEQANVSARAAARPPASAAVRLRRLPRRRLYVGLALLCGAGLMGPALPAAAQDLVVGDGDSVDIGTRTTSDSILVGNGSSGSTTLGAGETLTMNVVDNGTTRVELGNGGSGTLSIDGGTLTVNVPVGSDDTPTVGRIWVGGGATSAGGGSGTLDMNAGLIQFLPPAQATNDYGAIAVGRGTGVSGQFDQSGGTTSFQSTGAVDIGTQGGNGIYALSGDAVFDAGHGGMTLYVGSRTSGGSDGSGTASTGTLHISDNAQFTMTTGANSGGQLFVGDARGTGSIVQDGAGSVVTLSLANPIRFGSNVNSGADSGGTGSYLLSAGTLNVEKSGTANSQIIFGDAAGGTGTFAISGGTANFSGTGLVVANQAGSTGLIDQTGGTLSLTDGAGISFGSGAGTYQLLGGNLLIGGANAIAGNGSLVFGNATLGVQGSNFSSSMAANLVDGTTFTFDTRGLDATWSGALSGGGGLTKAGDGTLTLTTADTYTGLTTVAGGTLALTGDTGDTSVTGFGGGVAVAQGAILDLTGLDTPSVVMLPSISGSGTIDNGTNALVAGTDNRSTSFSGTIHNDGVGWNGEAFGTFTKVGTGTLDISGATIEGGEAYVAGGALAQHSGDTSVTYLAVGEGTGNSGALNVSGGSLTFGTALQVGDFGGTGTVTQTGGSVAVVASCGEAAHCPALNIGNQGGNGTYTITGGTLSQDDGQVVIGRNDASHNASTGVLAIGGTGAVSIGGSGGLIVGDNLSMSSGGTAGSGTINQTGGSLSIGADAQLYLSGSGNGTYNLDGGVLQIGGSSLHSSYNSTDDHYAFNLGGGTIQVTGSALAADVNATLAAGTSSTLDTNGLGATWSGVFSGAGGLTKAGAGTLTLTSANSYTGLTTVTGGTLALTGDGSIAGTSGLVLGSGGIFDISGMTTTIADTKNVGIVLPSLSGSGTVDNGNNALVAGTDNRSTSFSGTIHNDGVGWNGDAFGTFTKVGTGTLDISGATIEGGEAYVAGGALAQNGGDTHVTYLAVGEGTGNSGALNVSGGSLTFGTALQVGDFGGTGTVTQTGGSVAVVASCGEAAHCPALNIGNQGGTGTYTITGGSLSQDDGVVVIGRNEASYAASTGVLAIGGTGVVNIGGKGQLIVGDNAAMSGGSVAGSGTINQTGGTLSIGADAKLYLSGSGAGTYNLDGGVLQIGGGSLHSSYNSTDDHYAFNLGGGAIQSYGSALQADVDATLAAGTTSTLDTNGLGMTWSGTLSGAGALAKAGAGTLTLTGANRYTGGTRLDAGTLRLEDAGGLGSGVLAMAEGTTLDLAGSYTLANRITVSGDPTINVDAGQSATLAGAIGDGDSAGDIVKTGGGSLATTAVNTYTGATTISQGALALVGDGSIADSSRVVADATLDISAANGGASIKSLAGSGAVALGDRTLTLTAADDTFAGAIAGSGGLTLAGGHQVLSGDNTYTGATTVSGGELQVDGSLASAVSVSGSGRLSGSGSVGGLSVGAGSVLAPGGQDIGTITVDGDFSQAAGAIYQAQLAADGSADLIRVSGAADLADGAVLAIDRAGGGSYALGTRYTVLTAAGGVQGSYVLSGDTSLSAFYGLRAGQDADSVYLDTVQVRAFAAAGLTRNQVATAGALDALAAASGLRNAVGSSATDAAARGAFDQLSGELHASARTALFEQSGAVREATGDRLRQAFCVAAGNGVNVKSGRLDGQAGDACGADGAVVWQRTFGSWGDTGGDGNAARLYRSDSGFLLGADRPAGESWRLGAFGGYDQSTFDAAQRRGSGTSDNYDLGVYGGAQWNRLGLRLGAAYSSHNLATDRDVAFGGFSDSLHGGYHGRTAQVYGELGYLLRAGPVRFEPFAGAAYVNLRTDAFDEHGGAAALHGRGDSDGMAFSTLGVRPSAAFRVGGATLTVDGTLGWRHAYGSRTPTSTLSFAGGGAFSTAGVPVARDAAVVEAGIDAAIAPDLKLGLSYSGQFGGGTRDQGFRASFSLAF